MEKNETSLFDICATRIDGSEEKLDKYRGKVVLVVNVASKCGFTGQYSELESLYRDLRDRGFVVLGFPCNQFGFQEPGNNESIQQFCSTKYEVSFPMFSKIDVNGANAHPLYSFLKKAAPGVLGSEAIKWNFTKFLVSSDGRHVERFASTVPPSKLRSQIESMLANGNASDAN